MRPVARLAYLLVVLALLFAVGAFGLLSMADRERLVADTSRELGILLGREVLIDGAATVGLWPVPGIRTGAVATPGDGLLTAPAAVIVPHPLHLVRGETRPWLVVLIRPGIGLDLFALPTLTQPRPGSSLRHVAALAGTVTLRARAGAAQTRIGRVSMLASIDTAGRPRAIDLAGDWRGRAVRLEARAEDATPLAAGDGRPVQLDIAAGDDWLTFSGLFGREDATGRIAADGRAELRLADPEEIADALDLPLPTSLRALGDVEGSLNALILPDDLRLHLNTAAALGGHTLSLQARILGGPDWRERGPGTVEIASRAGALYSAYASGGFTAGDRFEGTLTASALDLPAIQDWLRLAPGERPVTAARVSASAALTADRRGIELTDGTFTIDGKQVTGRLGLSLGARRTLTGALSLPQLDLGRLGGATHQRLRRALRALEEAGTSLSLTVETERLVHGDLPLGEMHASLTHRDGIAEAELGRLGAFGGLLTGHMRLPTRGPAELEATIAFAEVDAAALARAAGLAIVTGTAAGDARIMVPNLDAPDTGRPRASAEISVYDGALALPLGPGAAAPFRRLDARIGLADGRMEVRDLTLRAAGGGYHGRLAIRLMDRVLTGALSPGDDRLADHRLEFSGTVDAPVVHRIAVAPPTVRRNPPVPPPPEAGSPAAPGADFDAGAAVEAEPAAAPAPAIDTDARSSEEAPAAAMEDANAPAPDAGQDATDAPTGRVPVPVPARR